MALLSGRAAELLTRFTAWLYRIWQGVVRGVGVFFQWLFELLPAVESDLSGEGFDSVALPGGAMEGVTESSGFVLYLLIGAVMIALLYCVVRMWRTVQMQGRRQVKVTAKPTVVRKRNLWDVLRRFFERLMKRVRFELHYLRSRNTPQGLLVWLERRMTAKRMGRKRGESIAAFLLRVAQQLPEWEGELRELSRCLDRCYFGGGDTMGADAVRALRKGLKKAMRQPTDRT